MRAPALLAVAAWVATCLAAAMLVAGWIDPAVRHHALRPERLLVGAAFSAALAVRLARRRQLDLLQATLADVVAHRVVGGAVLLALVALLAGLTADSVGGSDSAGYLAQAQRWRAGALRQALPLPDLPHSSSAWVQSPLGFRPSSDTLATVPIYPPGWPLLLAAMLPAGESAAIRTLPLAFAALALIALFLIASRHATPAAAWLAATSLASSAPFLFQALQPMSDVPALALWLTAFLLAPRPSVTASVGAAALAAVAVAVRPNLAPLLLAVGWMTASGRPAGTFVGAVRALSNLTAELHTLLRAVGIMAPGLIVLGAVAWLQAANYGNVWQSGYGRADELFALAHMGTNLTRQLAWLTQALSWPAIALLAVGAVGLLRSSLLPAPLSAAVLIVWFAYLVYQPFDDWTYLRFVLLPIAVLLLAGSVVVDAACSRFQPLWHLVAVSLIVVLVGSTGIAATRDLGVLDVRRNEARYRLAADFVRREALPQAVLLAAQHSGALAAYTDLPVLRLDLLQPTEVVSLLHWLEQRHRPVYLVLDIEEQRTLAALGDEGIALDWPPRARAGSPARALVWSLDDRAAYLAGRPVPTARLFPSRR